MLQEVNPLLALAVLLLGGLLGGYLARLAHLPHVIGQIIVGVVINIFVLGLTSFLSLRILVENPAALYGF